MCMNVYKVLHENSLILHILRILLVRSRRYVYLFDAVNIIFGLINCCCVRLII